MTYDEKKLRGYYERICRRLERKITRLEKAAKVADKMIWKLSR